MDALRSLSRHGQALDLLAKFDADVAHDARSQFQSGDILMILPRMWTSIERALSRYNLAPV